MSKRIALPWSRLRWFGSSRVIQTSYLWLFAVPALAKLLEALESPVVMEALGPGWVLTLELPFSWKVFYFSALAFAVGTITYHLRCPRLIRDHSDLGDFGRQGKSLAELWHYAAEVGVEADRDPRVYPNAPKERWEIDQDRLRERFWKIWNISDDSRPLARGVANVCYAIGLSLAVIVVIQNLVFVVKAL